VESVFAQSHPAGEVIVVDDGSSAETYESLKPYLPALRYIHMEENRGVSAARNLGVSAAKGKYIAFLDSDDIFLPDKLAAQLPLMKEASASHTDEHWFRRDRFVNQGAAHSKYGGEIFCKILDKCRISPSSFMIEKALFEGLGGFNENLRVCEDYEFFLRLASKHSVAYLPKKLIIKRAVAENSLSAGIKYIESIRLGILEDFAAQMEPDSSQKECLLSEIARKRGIVKQK
jgi:glycosyltransferase involved in cell wall biosynthesis